MTRFIRNTALTDLSPVPTSAPVPQRRIVIVGATSAMAEHCARLWLQQHPTAQLVLIARDTAKLDRVARDLQVRHPQAQISPHSCDFVAPEAITQCIDGIAASGPIDIALIAHGTLPDQSACQRDLQLTAQTLEINAISPMLFAERIALHMEQSRRGQLALIGSVAGDRGRQSNYVYGAAKGLMERYAQGLQHRFAGQRYLTVTLIKPGPTATPMTANLSQNVGQLASVESVAADIVAGVHHGKAVVYAPGKWWLIMMVIRHLPRFVFNKMRI